jgi:trigger factor
LQVTINPISQTEQEAHITLSSDELKPHFDTAYKKFQPTAQVKGFRKGKVPMEMVKRLYGQAIEQDALDDIANDSYRKAMEEKNIEPIGRPSLMDMDFKPGGSLSFKIKYEVKPPVELKSYTGITVVKLVHTVTDAEVDAEIDHLRRANSTTTEVSVATDEEHVVTGNVQELDEQGTPLIGRKQSQARFLLSDTSLAKEIRDALRGATVGETYRTTFTSQHDSHTHTVNVAIAVTKVEQVHLPPVDETLVKKLTGDKMTSVEEFRTNLRADLERYWNEQSERKLTDDIIDEVVRRHDFPIPDTMVNAFLQTFIEDIKSRSRDRQLPRDFDEKKFREENRSYAVWQAKWMLLKEQIAEAEKISVTDDDILNLAEAEATRTGIDKERILQYYRGSNSAAERLMTDRIVALLKSTAKIKEKPDTK